jgi:cyclopropane fatty-acyl-phospholipid synthase-like methyltransferase
MSDQGSYWSDKGIRRIEKNAFTDVADGYLNGSENILDIGCGRGEDSLHFARRGCTVTAIDISEVNVKHLQSAVSNEGLTNVRVLLADVAQPFVFKNGEFDAVYAHLSVHYFDDETTKRIFEEIKRILKPGGLLFVKCKSVDDLLYGKGEKVGEDMYKEEHVRHFFSEDYMRECLSLFDVISVDKTSGVYLDYRSDFIEAVARKSS